MRHDEDGVEGGSGLSFDVFEVHVGDVGVGGHDHLHLSGHLVLHDVGRHTQGDLAGDRWCIEGRLKNRIGATLARVARQWLRSPRA